MHADDLFLATTSDLAQRISGTPSEYDLLRCSGLLRQLLLDSTPLVHRVKRRDVSSRFFARPLLELPPHLRQDLRIATALDAFDPNATGTRMWPVVHGTTHVFDAALSQEQIRELQGGQKPPDQQPIQSYSVSQFVKAPVIRVNDQTFTVGDVIKLVAHVEGGVHSGRPSDDRQQLLLDYHRYMNVNGYEACVHMLIPIARVVLRGLQPLRDRIEFERSQSVAGE